MWNGVKNGPFYLVLAGRTKVFLVIGLVTYFKKTQLNEVSGQGYPPQYSRKRTPHKLFPHSFFIVHVVSWHI